MRNVMVVMGLLFSGPALAEVPPEVQALAEATCKADGLCEAVEVQMVPGGRGAFLWLEGSLDCGALGCPTWVLTAEGGRWTARDSLLVTEPLSVRWLEGGDLVFDGPTGAKAGKPICPLIWRWTGEGVEATEAWEQLDDCVPG